MGQKVTLLDRSEWTFINGDWHDGPDGELLPSDSLDIPLIAVRHKSTYGDLRVSFRFRIEMTGGVQFLFGLQDPSHYYALDFPACGQQVRAKHFWAGLSKSLGHGHDEYLGLEMVPGVPAEYGRWYKARLERRGSCIRAWIEDRPSLAVSDDTYKSGYVGLLAFAGPVRIADLKIEGTAVEAEPLQPGVSLCQPWFHPVDDPDLTDETPRKQGAEKKPQVIRLDNDELLLLYARGEVGGAGQVPMLSCRSADLGASWSRPEVVFGEDSGCSSGANNLFQARDGRIVFFSVRDMKYDKARPNDMIRACQASGRVVTYESHDNGRTWRDAKPLVSMSTGPWPSDPELLWPYGQPVRARDGSLVVFLYGSKAYGVGPNYSLQTWGLSGWQAFALRSTDEGQSWSIPINLDAPNWPGTEPGSIDGCHDLTEAHAALTGDGRLIGFVRPVASPYMWQIESKDDGRSWEPCSFGPFPGYCPCIVRTASDVLVCFHRYPYLCANLSYDDGASWTVGTRLDYAGTAMCSVVEVAPDVLLNIYMGGSRVSPSRLRAQFLRVTSQGLVPQDGP